MQLLPGNIQIVTKTNKDTKYKLILKLAISNACTEMILIDTVWRDKLYESILKCKISHSIWKLDSNTDIN